MNFIGYDPYRLRGCESLIEETTRKAFSLLMTHGEEAIYQLDEDLVEGIEPLYDKDGERVPIEFEVLETNRFTLNNRYNYSFDHFLPSDDNMMRIENGTVTLHIYDEDDYSTNGSSQDIVFYTEASQYDPCIEVYNQEDVYVLDNEIDQLDEILQVRDFILGLEMHMWNEAAEEIGSRVMRLPQVEGGERIIVFLGNLSEDD